MGFRVWGLGYGVEGLGFRAWGLGLFFESAPGDNPKGKGSGALFDAGLSVSGPRAGVTAMGLRPMQRCSARESGNLIGSSYAPLRTLSRVNGALAQLDLCKA